MKKFTAVLLIIFCVFSVCACDKGTSGLSFYGIYGEFWNYSVGDFTYNASEISKVEINWVGGEITVSEGEGETLSVSENGGGLDSEEQLHYYIKNDKLIIHYCESGYTKAIDSSQKHLKVQVPAGIDIDIDNVSADVKIGSMTLGELEITNVSGDIDFEGLNSNNLEIEIVSGKIRAEELLLGSLKVNGVSGSVDIKKIAANEIDIQIVSGKTNIGLAKKADVDISGVSGNVTLKIPSGIGAKVEFSSVSGKLNSALPHTSNKDVYVFGDGEITVDVETVSGNLYIE